MADVSYTEEDYLLISGLQHFSFCRRQWALIHIEMQWAENVLTTEGSLMHKNAHDVDKFEMRGDLMIVRSMRVSSRKLGVSGQCDIVEFHRDPKGVILSGHEGKWKPYPVEYKRGKSKSIDADRLQLCCQTMCLEEMLCCDIPEGALFYGETRRRERVPMDEGLRKQVLDSIIEMHQDFERGYTPKVKPSKACKSCSMVALCLPELLGNKNAHAYLKSYAEESE